MTKRGTMSGEGGESPRIECFKLLGPRLTELSRGRGGESHCAEGFSVSGDMPSPRINCLQGGGVTNSFTLVNKILQALNFKQLWRVKSKFIFSFINALRFKSSSSSRNKSPVGFSQHQEQSPPEGQTQAKESLDITASLPSNDEKFIEMPAGNRRV